MKRGQPTRCLTWSGLIFLLFLLATAVNSVPLAPDFFGLNCGGESIGTRFFNEQYSWLVGGVTNTDADSKPNVFVAGAEPKNAEILKTNRYARSTYTGKWGYRIPVENPGIFECTVHFAEIETKVSAS